MEILLMLFYSLFLVGMGALLGNSLYGIYNCTIMEYIKKQKIYRDKLKHLKEGSYWTVYFDENPWKKPSTFVITEIRESHAKKKWVNFKEIDKQGNITDTGGHLPINDFLTTGPKNYNWTIYFLR